MEVTQHEDPPRYEHGETCTPEDLYTAPNWLLGCRECEGMFDPKTKVGIRIMDPRIV